MNGEASNSVVPTGWRRWPVALHRRLLPDYSSIGWTPYLWLVYLSFFLWRWLAEGPSPTVLALGMLTLGVFLRLYFGGFWRHGRGLLWNIAGLVGLGVLWTPHNSGAMVFFVYAAGFCGAVGPPRVAWRALGAVAAAVAAAGWAFGQHPIWLTFALAFTFVIGAANLYFADANRKNDALRRSREEAEQLAALAERERIARDLHDLLGHTLSLITLKAELARKLVERGDGKALGEIRDVETISRDALRQVREAVTGFRHSGLAGEMTRARVACDAKGIELTVQGDDLDLDPRREATLAMVLREAVTNVVRHSGAGRCGISFERQGDAVTLTVEDDGRGTHQGPLRHGQGLAGMRQRLAELGGNLQISSTSGWRVTAFLPGDSGAPQVLTRNSALRRMEPESPLGGPLPEAPT